MSQEIHVVGAILVQDGKILCAQRSKDKSLPLKWEFPGGKLETGESVYDALRREIREELLVDVDLAENIFYEDRHSYDFATIHLTTIFATIKDQQVPVRTEHEDLRWLLPTELKTLDWAEADIATVDKLSQMVLD